MTVIDALRTIRKNPVTLEGRAVAPVVWEDRCLGQNCGSCTLVINGRVGLGCRVLVADLDRPVRLEPLSQFRVIRDLVVDREAVEAVHQRLKAWMSVEGYGATAVPPKRPDDEPANQLADCTGCLACLEACPQYGRDNDFVGALGISLVYRFSRHPNGRPLHSQRMTELMKSGGVTDCDNAKNCVAVCPVKMPLATAIGRMKREAMVEGIRRVFQ